MAQPVRFAKLALVLVRDFSLDHTSTFWVDLADPAAIAGWLGNVPGVYSGKPGYTTGYGPNRLGPTEWVHPDWRHTGSLDWQNHVTPTATFAY